MIKSTRFIGTVTYKSSSNWSIIGQDGGQSINLGDQNLFVFSDTLIASIRNEESTAPCPTPIGKQGIFRANCAGISSKKDLKSALSQLNYFIDGEGLACQIIEPTTWEHHQRIRFWPLHGIYVDGRVYLYYLGIKTIDSSSIWGFKNVGNGLAILNPEHGNCKRIFQNDDWRLWKTGADDFHFGVQAICQDQKVYIFASVRTGLFFSARLARVDFSLIEDPTAYEFLCSTVPHWSRDVNEAYNLGECSSDYSVSYNPYIKKFMMIYVEGYEKKLTMRVADEIWGPYSKPLKIISVPRKKSSEMVYLGFEHPQFRNDNGKKIYISYCQPYFSANSLLTLTFW